MSSKNKKSRTLASRLTIWNAVIYIVFFGGAFLIFYLSINYLLRVNIDDDLKEDIAELGQVFEANGYDALKQEIEREIFSDGPEDIFFRIFDPTGNILFSTDLSQWSEVELNPQLPDSLVQDRQALFETINAPDDDYDARVITDWIGSDRLLQIGESLEDTQEVMALLSIIFMATFTLVVMFASAAGWILAHRALRGVEEVSKAAIDVTDGTLGRRVKSNREGAEIEHLASTFNSMLDRIDTLITGMREMTDNVAHDLRSPLTRIRANAEMVLSGDETLDDYRKSAADTLEECDRLMHMINTTLDVAEAEACVAYLSSEPIDISTVASDACELFDPIAEDRGVRLSTDISADCLVRGNLPMLQRMIANLLDNAIKYSGRNSNVNVSVQSSGDNVLLSVSDEGSGISRQEQTKIFDRFYRCDASRSKTGCGLGLSLVRAIVIAHGGRIDVSSMPDKGSEFVVSLPKPAIPGI